MNRLLAGSWGSWYSFEEEKVSQPCRVQSSGTVILGGRRGSLMGSFPRLWVTGETSAWEATDLVQVSAHLNFVQVSRGQALRRKGVTEQGGVHPGRSGI
jgi:hypothetical protein